MGMGSRSYGGDLQEAILSEITEISYIASIMPCRIMQDASMRTIYSSPLDHDMNAVQAILTQWMMDGQEIEITVKLKSHIVGEDLDGKTKRRRDSKKG